MAITQISRVKARSGKLENLPEPLSGGELGWANDVRRLFIGNGTLAEGAPTIGNTEILTEFSNILGLSAGYTYKGERAGYVVRTGSNATAPVTRSLQSKIDEWVSVLDFGAKGDNVTDDTDAINRALQQLFCEQSNTEIRRALLFPAGRYLVSDAVLIPPNAILIGEGLDSSLIVLASTATVEYVATTADNLQQVDGELGTNGAVLPRNISIRDMAFVALSTAAPFRVNTAQDVTFTNVKFKAKLTSPTGDGNIHSFEIYSNVAANSNNIQMNGCEFTGANKGLYLDYNCRGVSVTGSRFSECYTGAMVSSPLIGTGTENLRITHSYFDKIYETGIKVDVGNVDRVLSAFNTFIDVGTQYNGTSAGVIYSAIDFGAANCASMMDFFKYTDPDVPTVEFNGKPSTNFTFDEGLITGSRQEGAGYVATLDASSTDTIDTYLTPYINAGKINYRINLGTAFRSGTIEFAWNGTTVAWDDSYTETAPMNVSLSVSVDGSSNLAFVYNSSAVTDATISYSLSRHN